MFRAATDSVHTPKNAPRPYAVGTRNFSYCISMNPARATVIGRRLVYIDILVSNNPSSTRHPIQKVNKLRKYSLLILMAMGLLSLGGIVMAANGRWTLLILCPLSILTALLMLFCTRHITRHSSTMTNKVRDELQRSASELNAEMEQIMERLAKQSDEINSKVSGAKKYLEEQITSFRQENTVQTESISQENTVQAEATKRVLTDLASQHGKQIEESVRANRIAVEAAKTSIETRMRVFEERPSEQNERTGGSHEDEFLTD